jgi:hypothetical protein
LDALVIRFLVRLTTLAFSCEAANAMMECR